MNSPIKPLYSGTVPDPAELASDYQEIRRITASLTNPLEIEDYVIQAMANVSPPKWHLGHVSWFFEKFLLQPNLGSFKAFNPDYMYLFNSYYEGAGPQFHRLSRGLLSRPTVEEVYKYRKHVDESMLAFMETLSSEAWATLVVLGLNHEQQGQELLLTDIKYNLSINPLRPAYHGRVVRSEVTAPPMRWLRFDGGLCNVGYQGSGFAFDNEGPNHTVYLAPYYIASRPVTNGEFLEFMEADGYKRSDLWLSGGWKTVQS